MEPTNQNTPNYSTQNWIDIMENVNYGLIHVKNLLLAPDLRMYKNTLQALEGSYRAFAELKTDGNAFLKVYKNLTSDPNNLLVLKINSAYINYKLNRKTLQEQLEICWAKELCNFIPTIRII